MDKNNSKKAWYKKWWVWVIIVIVLIGIGGAAGGNTGNNTTNTDTETSNSDSKQTDAPSEPKEEKWDVEKVYAKIKDGMTKKQVEKAVGKESDNCSESSSEYVGKTELCTYGSLGDNGSITVTFQNDKVSSKSKMKF